jgi:hypothetical protein
MQGINLIYTKILQSLSPYLNPLVSMPQILESYYNITITCLLKPLVFISSLFKIKFSKIYSFVYNFPKLSKKYSMFITVPLKNQASKKIIKKHQ